MGRKSDEQPQTRTLTEPDALVTALAHHHTGRFAEAESDYRRLLQAQPDHVDAWHLWGVLAAQQGQYQAAVHRMQRALTMKPHDPVLLSNLGNAYLEARDLGRAIACYQKAVQLQPGATELRKRLAATCERQLDVGIGHHREGRLVEAESCYQDVLRGQPERADAWHLLGAAASERGQLDTAIKQIERAIELAPKAANFHNSLGAVYQKQQRFAKAEAAFRRAAEVEPQLAQAHYNLGNTLAEQGRLADAEASHVRALEIDPNSADGHYNLGCALQGQGRVAEAEARYRRALEINPDFAAAHCNLGNALKNQGKFVEAEACYRRALEVQPDLVEAYSNLGNAFNARGRLTEAEACYRKALAINPDYAYARYVLGENLKEQGRLLEAEACYRQTLEIDPNFARARLAQAMMTLPMVAHTVSTSLAVPAAFDRALRDLSTWLVSSPVNRTFFSRAIGSQQPFYLAYRDGNHVQSLSRYGDLVTEDPLPTPTWSSPDRKKVRIAIVSHHLCRHSVWDIIIRGFLLHLDRSRFELFLYQTGHKEDKETEFARSIANLWRGHQTVGSLPGCLDALAADQPDVIFYPEIGMDSLSLRLAARRLAALQVVGWGHPITTGLPTIDLYLSGELIEAPQADAHYRERLVRLPGTGCCTTPIDIVPEEFSELAQRRGVLFVIPQRAFKFDPAHDVLYGSIAAAVGECTFILLRDGRFPWATQQVNDRLAQAFRDRRLDPQKHILMIPWLSRERFHGLLDVCDVCLDCPAFSGYTTAWQAIHRGLPVVTLEGQFLRQRLAAGLLRKIGVTDTIATSAADYVSIAARLAVESRDPNRRRARRQAIKAAASHADEDVTVVRAFEQALVDALADRGRRFEFSDPGKARQFPARAEIP
ncbi:MAG: tetratricopeptide repeat protein [Candidatus Accumulibacter sp.]|nr:tetratricopeptide repeat protein [Accumulibacter sp.]